MQTRLWGVAFLIAGVIMLIIVVVRWLKILSFKNCETVLATVMDVHKSNHYSNGRSRTSFSLDLTYNVDGTDYQKRIACDADDYRQGANRQVEILYKSRNPKRIMLCAPAKNSRAQLILWIITLVLLAIGAVMVFLIKQA